MNFHSIFLMVLQPLCGLAIFLYASKFLSKLLEETLLVRFSKFFGLVNKNSFVATAIGFILTMLFQVSGITIISTMGLLAKGLLTTEAALMIVLGSMVGATVKTWFITLFLIYLPPILIIISSFVLYFTKNVFYRKILELLLTIGFILYGIMILTNGVVDISEIPQVKTLLNSFQGISFMTRLGAFLIATLFSILFQSGSTVVLIVISMAMFGTINYRLASVLILGANIGTAIKGMRSAMDYQAEVKRLAFSHMIVKIVGSLMALFFYGTFSGTIEFFMIPFGKKISIATKLASIYTGLNLINMMIWVVFSYILVRVSQFVFPKPVQVVQTELWTKADVKNLLIQIPQMALEKLSKQLYQILLYVKAYEEYLQKRILGNSNVQSYGPTPADLELSLNAGKKILFEILMMHPQYKIQAIHLCQTFTDVQDLLSFLTRIHSRLEALGKKRIETLLEQYPLFEKKVFESLNFHWNELIIASKMGEIQKANKSTHFEQYFGEKDLTMENSTTQKGVSVNDENMISLIHDLFREFETLEEKIKLIKWRAKRDVDTQHSSL